MTEQREQRYARSARLTDGHKSHGISRWVRTCVVLWGMIAIVATALLYVDEAQASGTVTPSTSTVTMYKIVAGSRPVAGAGGG